MFIRTLGALVVLGFAVPLAAQTPDSASADSAPAGSMPTEVAPAPVDTVPAQPLPTVFQPVADLSRGVDAELRMALLDLVEDRPLTALSRLEWLQRSVVVPPSPARTGGRSAAAPPPLRATEDLLFLLAETYYRLGLGESFRSSAQQLLATLPASRYVPLLQMQLMLDAYRSGDYAGARARSGKLAAAPDPSLADFVAGLAAYQLGDMKRARVAFAAVVAAGNEAYVPYARFMDALAAMQGDSARAAATLAALRPVAASAAGPFADQVRLAAAQLALYSGDYAAAAEFATQLSPASGLAPDAQLVHAWALYRAGQADSAAALFGDFAARWPLLPARDEARLMHAQILLEQQHPAEAAAYYAQMADSMGMERSALQTRLGTAMPQAARSLVDARAGGALFVREAERGKSLALAPGAGAEAPLLIAAFGAAPAPARIDAAAPVPLTVADVQARIDSVNPPLPAEISRRPFYLPASTPAVYADFLVRDQSLFAADLASAVARFRLQLALGDHAMRMATMRNLQRLIAEGSSNLGEVNRTITFTQDSLAKLTALLAVARQVLHEAILSQSAAASEAATLNIGKLDSLRTSLGTSADSTDTDIIATERKTAVTYRRVAAEVATGLDSAINRHPVFVLRDSLAARVVRARGLSVQGQQLLATNTVLVASELMRLQSTESERTRAARAAVAAADQRRTAAESQLVTLLDGELRARATTMLERLARSREAAEYGSASAAFFVAIDTAAGATAASPVTATPGAVTGAPRDVAIDRLSTFVDRYAASPYRADALFQLGELLIRRADANFAAAQRASQGSGGPDRPDYAPAIIRYTDLITKYPAFDRIDAAAYTLGTVLFANDEFAAAAKMFALVTQKKGSHFRPESFFRLGDAQFELAVKARGEERRKLFVTAAVAYDSATRTAPAGGDIYFLALYKLGWSYYNQATKPGQAEYDVAVSYFGRLVTEYDQLTPDQQARLGLRRETVDYMAVSLTQVGGAAAAGKYFAAHPQAGPVLELTVLRRLAASLRDQGDFGKAVTAYQEIQQKAPTDSTALAVQQDIVDTYQNRILEPAKAQEARLALVADFAPGTPWALANPALEPTAQKAREQALRQSAEYALSVAQRKKEKDKTVIKTRYAEAAALYAKYLGEFGQSDSAQVMSFYEGEAQLGAGDYTAAGLAYSRAAFNFPGKDAKIADKAGQDAIVALDSATAHGRGDRAVQDSLFAVVSSYVAAFPESPLAKTALIQKGKRASEAKRWDVMEATFREYANKYPNDAYTPTAQKLIGDALYKRGEYSAAEMQWETAGTLAGQAGKKPLADSIARIRDAAAVSFGDSLVKSGDYARAAQEVYIAYADRNPTSPKSPDALRNAVETYMLADSVARAKPDSAASRDARMHALAVTERLLRDYPKYKYRVQYLSLQAQLLGDFGQRDSVIMVLSSLVKDEPKWPGRADAMVRIAVEYDSLGKPKDAADAYERFARAYPADKRAADAQMNAAVTYLQAGDSAAAGRAYGSFAQLFPRDKRVADANAARIALLRSSGATSTADTELAKLCAKGPVTGPLKVECAARAGSIAFKDGQAQWAKYQALALVIPKRGNLTRAGVARLSAPKKQLLTKMSADFAKAIASGAPEWVAAGSYFAGLGQWEYGNFLSNVTLPAELTDQERAAGMAGAAKQGEQYYQAANKLWKALVDKSAADSFTNVWVDRARAALEGKVDANPDAAAAPVAAPASPAPPAPAPPAAGSAR